MDKSLKVVKSNALIEASYRLTLAEQRIILACLAQVNPREEVTDEEMYRVTTSALADMTGLAAKAAYREMVRSAEKLRERTVRITHLPDGTAIKGKYLIAGWVQTVAYIEKEGAIEVRFNKDILPYLSQLSTRFTQYKLEHVAKMQSSYGMRLYELLIQWQSKGEREIEIGWLKKQWGLENKYKAIDNFKARVVSPAIADINAYSNLWVKNGYRKSGRTVTHLQLQFGLKTEQGDKKPKVLTRREAEKMAKPGETYEKLYARLGRDGIHIK